MKISAQTITALLKDLKTFGLNPKDWSILLLSPGQKELRLIHREEQELELRGNFDLRKVGRKELWHWTGLEICP